MADAATFIAIEKTFRLQALERQGWKMLQEGEDGLGLFQNRNLRLIHSVAVENDDEVWAHVSLSRRDRVMPTWEQTRDAWRAVYPDVAGVVVIPPEAEHVNIAEVAHVWGCLTVPTVPDFTRGGGTI